MASPQPEKEGRKRETGNPKPPELISDGVVIIDKPPGMASHEITTFVKKITGAKRAGHAGTLDPEVSGVLPVALGRATKLLQYIAGKDKTYVGIVKFRNPMDAAGIAKLFAVFTGTLTQTPPKISAVRKVPRKRTVHSLKLLEAGGRLALFEARVDAGTYIRTLCEDMGQKVGGARMEELRRTAVGRITEREASTMQELVDAMWFWKEKGDGAMLLGMLKPPEAFIDLPKVVVKETALKNILSGAQVMVPGIVRMDDVERGGRVAIYCGAKFVGVGVAQCRPEEAETVKGPVVKLERVHGRG